MIAIMLSTQLLADTLDEAIRYYNTEALPHLRNTPTMRTMHSLLDRDNNRVVVLTFWATEFDFNTYYAEAQTQLMLSGLAPFLAEPLTREMFEVFE